MKVVFCGTPQFAVPTLKRLLTQPDFEIAAVVTQPDRPRGRGMHVSFSPVKEAALAAGVPVHQPEKIRSPEAQEFLGRIAPDCIVIIAYGQIIPARLLPIPKHGWINLHASLLPKYRGAAPINWAIVNGETKSGLTSMRIDAGMDTGDMLLQTETAISPQETTPELTARMADIGAPLMVETLRGLAAGTLPARAQNHTEASYAPLLKKADGRIDWTGTANEIYNRMRGFTPWPGSYSTFRGRTCHILGEPVSNDLHVAASPHAADPLSATSAPEVLPPGTIRFNDHRLFVACGDATEIRVISVKQEGGNKVDALEFASGARLTEGERFVYT
jgi:methionyl-tRNA formyltransferase